MKHETWKTDMKIIDQKRGIEDLIKQTREVLGAGGLVVVPSDTVYGLSVDAKSKNAVEKLIKFKERPIGKAISVFVGNIENAKKYVEFSTQQESTIKTLTPGPYTFVVPSKHVLRPKLESEKGTLGIRIPDFDFVNQLALEFGNPITATSANISSTTPHHSVESLLNSLPEKKKDLIDFIIDFGKLPRNKPSTVIDLTEDSMKILRQGDARISSTTISNSEEETKNIAQQLLEKIEKEKSEKPVVLILQGDLGTGKTVFVKGIGEKLGVTNIISPTYIVCYEYKTHHDTYKKLHHCDFYILSEESELEYLGFDQMLGPENLICIEWGEKSEVLMNQFREKATVYLIQISHKGVHERGVLISNI